VALIVFAEDNDGDMVQWDDRLRLDTFEATISAAEASVGNSSLVLEDTSGDFYIRGLKPIYLQETDAADDDWFGIIGPFYAADRSIGRGDYRIGSQRRWDISMVDANTLLTRRLQKGTDAKREEETDIERMTWLINTAEVIGGGGDNGFTIEDTDYFFTDSPVPMSESDYTGLDSAGVINDCLQDSGKNCFVFNSPTASEPIRIGIWYGRTERTDFASIHKISNVAADISAAVLNNFEGVTPGYATPYVFPPSYDTDLDRSPSRLISGAMVKYDGGYQYVTRPETSEAFDKRDMSFSAELVKTAAQATRRANRYVRDLRNEDDAIPCSVLVPGRLIHAFLPGQRVQYKSSYMPGYSDYVWMRIAKITYRQVGGQAGDKSMYELAMDLRAEEPPDSATTGTGLEPCTAQTASTTFDTLGGSGSTANPSLGNVYYWRPGLVRPLTVAEAVGLVGSWHFPVFGAVGTTDYAGDCSQNRVRVLVEGSGTLTIHTAEYSGQARTLRGTLYHHRYSGDAEDPTSGVDIIDETKTGAAGADMEFDITTHDGEFCTHWVDLTDIGGVCGSKWGFSGADWVAS
jgi:hypothetical protein